MLPQMNDRRDLLGTTMTRKRKKKKQKKKESTGGKSTKGGSRKKKTKTIQQRRQLKTRKMKIGNDLNSYYLCSSVYVSLFYHVWFLNFSFAFPYLYSLISNISRFNDFNSFLYLSICVSFYHICWML